MGRGRGGGRRGAGRVAPLPLGDEMGPEGSDGDGDDGHNGEAHIERALGVALALRDELADSDDEEAPLAAVDRDLEDRSFLR